MTPPNLDEVVDAINSLKTGKAPGIDGIQAEQIKSGGVAVRRAMHTLIQSIWNKEQMPKGLDTYAVYAYQVFVYHENHDRHDVLMNTWY